MKGILTIFIFAQISMGSAQYVSPFNQRKIQVDSTGDYTFIVSGHFYGDGSNKSGYPANTLLGNLDQINTSNAAMLVCLGDLFMDVENDLPKYQHSIFQQLKMPLVNSVGNHDLSGNFYQEHFGKTYFEFQIHRDLHLVLDTELENGDITGEQLLLLQAAKNRTKLGEIDNVFIYTHRTIWSKSYSEMEGLFLDNTQGIGATNYSGEVLPILKEIGKNASVYLFSGSLGNAPASFFYFHDQPNSISIIGTAIRALKRDALLYVHVKQGKVSFETVSLTGETLMPLESYSVDFWKYEVGEEPFNWRLVPYYCKLMITHRYFWYGVLSMGFLWFIFWRFKRRKAKRVNKA